MNIYPPYFCPHRYFFLKANVELSSSGKKPKNIQKNKKNEQAKQVRAPRLSAVKLK